MRTLQSAPLCQQPGAWSACGQGQPPPITRWDYAERPHFTKATIVKCIAMDRGQPTDMKACREQGQASANDKQPFHVCDVGRKVM